MPSVGTPNNCQWWHIPHAICRMVKLFPSRRKSASGCGIARDGVSVYSAYRYPLSYGGRSQES